MKLVRRDEEAHAKQADAAYKAALEAHREHVATIEATNARLAADHERHHEAAVAAHADEVARLEAERAELEDGMKAANDALAAEHRAAVVEHAKAVEAAKSEHASEIALERSRRRRTEQERARVAKARAEFDLDPLPDEEPGVVRIEIVLPPEPTAPPEPTDLPPLVLPDPPEKTDAPEPLECPPAPVEPDAAPTYKGRVVKQAKDGEPWEMVETPWGPARALAGHVVVERDDTGERHVVPPGELERVYRRC